MNTPRLLRTALLANACFSAICALLLVTLPTSVGDLLGIQAPLVLRLLGCGLLLFSVDLVHQVMQPQLLIWRALYASVSDFRWVVGSILGLLLFPNLFSVTGVAMVLLVAMVVLVFGIWQMYGITRTQPLSRCDDA